MRCDGCTRLCEHENHDRRSQYALVIYCEISAVFTCAVASEALVIVLRQEHFPLSADKSMSTTKVTPEQLRQRIAHLETELSSARSLLQDELANGAPPAGSHAPLLPPFTTLRLPNHPLLLLSDTALPLGSFAFSSGLESYLAHHPPRHAIAPTTLPTFMHMSLMSLASSTLPYLLAVCGDPDLAARLDDELDACLLCPVARRASVAQGKGLVTVWERALRGGGWDGRGEGVQNARTALARLCEGLRRQGKGKSTGIGGWAWWEDGAGGEDDSPQPQIVHAHFPIVYALVCTACGLSVHETAFTYLFNHAKAVASAAVRAGVLGPYAAQGLLGSGWLKGEVEKAMEREWETRVEAAGQTVPALDLWMGRHELLYSRIFNS